MLFRSTQRSSENLETRSEFRTTSRCGDSLPTYDTVRRLEEKMITDVWTSGSSRDAMMELNEESIGGWGQRWKKASRCDVRSHCM